MQLRPNKSRIHGCIRRVERAPDGFGADIDVLVGSCDPVDGFEDFLCAKSGSLITLFAADPEGLEAGRDYELLTTLLGGPNGQRAVIETAQSE